MTDGGKGSDKGKFTNNTSNSLFYLSSIKGWGLAGKCDSRKQDFFQKLHSLWLLDLVILKRAFCFECLILRITISVSYHQPMKGCIAQKPEFTWRKPWISAAYPMSFWSIPVILCMYLTSLPRDTTWISAHVRNFCAQHSGTDIISQNTYKWNKRSRAYGKFADLMLKMEDRDKHNTWCAAKTPQHLELCTQNWIIHPHLLLPNISEQNNGF